MAEEKKLNENVGNTERKEPTYEELKNWCNQLMMQRNEIAQRFDQVTNIINKLPWLFEVIKGAEKFNAEFVDRCIKEIETILTLPTIDNTEEATDKNNVVKNSTVKEG